MEVVSYMLNKQSRTADKGWHLKLGTRREVNLLTTEEAIMPHKISRAARQKNMVMVLAGPGTKNGSAGEG
jgi:hypothetical protein